MLDYRFSEHKTVAFFTLGCKLNFAESSSISKQLLSAGFLKVKPGEPADVCIINTCTVTDSADKKCRQAIHKIIKSNPKAFIIVTGCYAQLKPEEILSIPDVDLVLGANDKFEIPELLKKSFATETSIICSDTKTQTPFFYSYSSDDRTRHFLKVQDGCDYFCTYCAIPFSRGRSRNGAITELVAQAQEIASEGGKEIVLSGVNIGDFGKSTGETFLNLIQALDEVEGIDRFRISSIEPNLLTDEIITFVAGSKRFVPHFHLPLQSGSNEVLRLMRRRYDTELFLQKVIKIKALMPNAFIGVDVIVGMRGETDAFFEDAFRFIERLDVSQLHVFSYSERANTQALKIEGKVSATVKKIRSKRLIELSEQKLYAFYKRQIGKDHLVLWESTKRNDLMFGFTENYVKVQRHYDNSLINSVEKVILSGLDNTDPDDLRMTL